MQLNPSDNSSRFVKIFGRLIDFIKLITSVLIYVLLGSVIIYGLFLFGRIVWSFLEMLFKAVGQF